MVSVHPPITKGTSPMLLQICLGFLLWLREAGRVALVRTWLEVAWLGNMRCAFKKCNVFFFCLTFMIVVHLSSWSDTFHSCKAVREDGIPCTPALLYHFQRGGSFSWAKTTPPSLLPNGTGYTLGQHVAEVVGLIHDVAVVLGVWRRTLQESALPCVEDTL